MTSQSVKALAERACSTATLKTQCVAGLISNKTTLTGSCIEARRLAGEQDLQLISKPLFKAQKHRSIMILILKHNEQHKRCVFVH